MVDLDLTADERYLRSCYLDYTSTPFQSAVAELRFLGPALFFASVTYFSKDYTFLWIGSAWLLGCYLYRFGTSRWTRAFTGLLTKYEERIKVLEAIASEDN